MHKKLPIWFGMGVVVLVVGIGIYAAWQALLRHEANYYGRLFTERIQSSVRRIDQATRQAFQPDFYNHLDKKPLSEMTQELDNDPTMRAYVQALYKIVRNPQAGIAMYTECPRENNAECYYDTLFGIPVKHDVRDYNPKSRPWYVLAEKHSDWVVFQFLSLHQSIPSFPRVPTLGIVRRLLSGDGPHKDEDGIWMGTFLHNPTYIDPNTGSPYLADMLMEGNPHSIRSMEVSVGSLLTFTDDMLSGKSPTKVSCNSIIGNQGLGYLASVHCMMNQESVHYTFSKTFDHPGYLLALIFLGMGILYTVYLSLKHVAALKQRNEEIALATSMEAKLVHDLKKGILSQLNRHFDTETPDVPRILHYVNLLNKYVALIGNNLSRRSENHWIEVTPEACKTYLQWILGEVPVHFESHNEAGAGIELIYNSDVRLRSGRLRPEFWVPEMGFYRILKNIIENYNTYGCDGLVIRIEIQDQHVVMTAKNAVAEAVSAKESSTRLGMKIILQLLEDNFGPDVELTHHYEGLQYELRLRFPQVSHDPTH